MSSRDRKKSPWRWGVSNVAIFLDAELTVARTKKKKKKKTPWLLSGRFGIAFVRLDRGNEEDCAASCLNCTEA
jgi:hypothetical protein